MTRRELTRSLRGAAASGLSATGASATGASATGAASLGTLAMGAMALGAMAVGALAVGRLSVGRARLRRVEIGELTVGRLEIGAGSEGTLTAVARIRAAPGEGGALEELLLDEGFGNRPGSLLFRAHRSRSDPDLFLFWETYADAAAFEQHAEASELEDLLRLALAEGLVAADGPGAVRIEFYDAL